MSSSRRKKKTEKDDGDAVEELLRATEEEMVLKLSVDSHLSRFSPSFSDPDLDRRFQALKSKQKPPPPVKANPNNPPAPTIWASDREKPQVDDLLARFAALKGSLPSNSSSSSNNQQPESGFNDDDTTNEEDEVEKVIRWAIDAARLDPSPPTDSDNDDDTNDDDDSDADADDRCVDGENKGKRK